MAESPNLPHPPHRVKLPDERTGGTHAFTVGDREGYLIYSVYPGTNQLGEIFVVIDKEGSELSGAYDSWARMVSVALQYGIPFKDIARKFLFSRFEPQGMTRNPAIPIASSIVDYIMRYLGEKFLSDEERESINWPPPAVIAEQQRLMENGGDENKEKD